MKHPREEELALFAGGDLGFIERWRVARHVRGCAECRGEIAGYEIASGVFTEAGERLPDGLDWNRIAGEMTANIRLGLAAGECVAPATAEHAAWRPAAVLASATLLIVTAWWLNVTPVRQQAALERQRALEAPIVQSAPGGIEVKSKSGALTLLRRRASSPVLYVSSPGSLRERFVDAETGQVTINNVYAE